MKLCGIVSYRLDGSFRYFCGMLCQVSPVSLVLLSFSVIVYNTGIYTWLYFRKSAKLVKVAALVYL